VEWANPDARLRWGDATDEVFIDYAIFAIAFAGLAIAAYRYGRPQHAGLVVLAILGQEALVRAMKALIARPRPDGAHSDSGAYPSGHVADVALAILLFLWLVLPLLRGHPIGTTNPRDAEVAAALVTLYAVYRAFTGEHWVTDVLGGVLLATALARAITWTARRYPPPRLRR
jgi:membrane-associated phospholipid phosphatase